MLIKRRRAIQDVRLASQTLHVVQVEVQGRVPVQVGAILRLRVHRTAKEEQ